MIITELFVYAQNGDPIDEDNDFAKIIPPSPIAYELGKYGQIPIGFFTGTPNISVPLYKFNAGLLTLDISLSYNSNGIKVDQLESNVGLGWSLNLGGVITRIVRDLPDEDSYQYFPEEDIGEDIYSPFAVEYFNNAANNPDMDSESDLYMYNFNGYSGKFTFSNNKETEWMPHNVLTLVPRCNELSEIYFEIITETGIKYVFAKIERATYLKQLDGGVGDDLNPPVITAWYLTQIIHPGGDQIIFNYEFNEYTFQSSVSQFYYKAYAQGGCPGGPNCGTANNIETYNNICYIYGQRVKEIHSNNPDYGTITVNYNQNHPDNTIVNYKLISSISVDHGSDLIENINFNYLPTENNRLFLSKINFKDIEKQYCFEYIEPELLCQRLSFSQDYWGYFNHKANYYFVPKMDASIFENSPWFGNRDPNNIFAQKGLLKKITYPTKGYSEFEYEMNTYWGSQPVYPPPIEIHLEAITDENTFGTTVSEVSSVIKTSHDVFIFSSVQFNINGGIECDPNTYPWPIEAIISIKNLLTNQYINIFNYSEIIGWYSVGEFPVIFENQDGSFKVRFEEGTSYEVTLKVLRPCLAAYLTLEYYGEAIEDIYTNIETGGSRIKKITVYDPISEKETQSVYYYNKYGDLGISSGDPGTKGYFIAKGINRLTCAFGDYYDCEYNVLGSESQIPLINSGNNNIYYRYVTLSLGGENFENGGETHEFIINRDVPGNEMLGSGFAQNGAAFTNIGWDHGLEKSTEVFKIINDQKIALSEQLNFFKNDERKFKISHSYSITKNFDLTYYGPYFYLCKEEDLTKIERVRICTENHQHTWAIGGVPFVNDEYYCIAPPFPFKQHNSWDTIYHPCYGGSEGDTIFNYNVYENLNIIEYINYSFWHYLDSTVFINYDQLGNNPVTTYKKYFYDNERHIQLTSTIEKDSKGNIIQTQLRYPQDYNEIENFANLIDANIISVPVVEEEYYNNKIIAGRLNKYNDLGLPIEIDKYENSDLLDKPLYDPAVITTIPEFYEKKIDIQYDPGNNKMIQQQPANDIITSYIWGYNFTQVVAKIENAEYYTVLQAMQTPIEGIQNMNDNELRSVFENLRSNLPNAMISSYTYKSGVGMTSETDPVGKTIYYEYDNFWRLKFIKDNDGNIIKRYRYHYKNQ